MNYEKEILHVLYEVGNGGLSVHKIAIHVHNACNSLFAPIAFADVHRDVQSWLLRNSRGVGSPVVRCGKRGYYAVNLSSSMATQLFLQFGNETKQQHEQYQDNADSATQQLPLEW